MIGTAHQDSLPSLCSRPHHLSYKRLPAVSGRNGGDSKEEPTLKRCSFLEAITLFPGTRGVDGILLFQKSLHAVEVLSHIMDRPVATFLKQRKGFHNGFATLSTQGHAPTGRL